MSNTPLQSDLQVVLLILLIIRHLQAMVLMQNHHLNQQMTVILTTNICPDKLIVSSNQSKYDHGEESLIIVVDGTRMRRLFYGNMLAMNGTTAVGECHVRKNCSAMALHSSESVGGVMTSSVCSSMIALHEENGSSVTH